MEIVVRTKSVVGALASGALRHVKLCCMKYALIVLICSVFLSSVGLSILLSRVSHLSAIEQTQDLTELNLRMLESSQLLFHPGMEPKQFDVFHKLDNNEVFPQPNGRNLTHNDLLLLVNPKNTCSGGKINLLICVISAPSYFNRRQLIRETWGSPKLRNDITIVFVLGRPSDEKILLEIGEESSANGDIVLGAFTDHYENLTIKSVLAYGWASQYCNANFFVKVDDDVLVNIFHLQRFVTAMTYHNDTTGVIFCMMQQRSAPYRHGKYGVSEWEYEGKHYPPFCSGPAYLMSRDVVSAIFRAALNRPMFRLEDVYLTGFLRHELGFQVTQGYKAYANRALVKDMLKKNFLVFGHSQNNTNNFRKIWARDIKI